MNGPEVHILMGLYNGAPYLDEQLESLSAQSHENWRLTCSDDGSTDSTCAIVRRFAEFVSQDVDLFDGPGRGFAENFMSMVGALPDDCGFIAFSDQDDIWLPDRLSRGVERLISYPLDQPALYGTASWIWDAEHDAKVPSLDQRRPLGFLNALIENFATGNTMLFNPAAARLLRDASRRIGPVFSHDWWAYALITGNGGRVIYDGKPALYYRQHQHNEIGAGETIWKRQLRNLSVVDGCYRRKVGQNIEALMAVRELLTPENRALLDAFVAAREASPAVLRLNQILRSGVYRQSRRDMLGFLGAAFLGKV